MTNATIATETRNIEDLQVLNRHFRLAYRWMSDKLPNHTVNSIEHIDGQGSNFSNVVLSVTNSDGDELLVELPCGGDGTDVLRIEDGNNVVISETLYCDYVAANRETVKRDAAQQKSVRDEKRQVIIEYINDFVGTDGVMAYAQRLAKVSILETAKGKPDYYAIDPAKTWQQFYQDEFEGFNDEDSKQSKERQFAKIILDHFQKITIPSLHGKTSASKELRESWYETYSDGLGLVKLNIGKQLMKEQSTGGVTHKGFNSAIVEFRESLLKR